MKALPFIVTISVGLLAGGVIWMLVPQQPAVAQSAIQKIYDHQDAGWASKDRDAIFYHVDLRGTQTDIHGTVSNVSELQNGGLDGMLFHGNKFHDTSKIVNIKVAGNTATVVTTFKHDYTMQNSTWNSEQGVIENFHEDGKVRDVWTRRFGEWWLESSVMLRLTWLRNGGRLPV